MVESTITAMLLVVAAIHLVPVTGFLGSERLSALYGVDVESSDLVLLMRHRAVLFGILGVFFVYAAFTPAVQPLAFIAAAISLVAFFYLAFSADRYGPAIRKIVAGDVVAAVALAIAVILYVLRAE